MVTCPVCKNKAEETETRYGLRHDCCGMHSWNGKPLVCEKTHEARTEAHKVFDPVWKEGYVKREDAYRILAKYLGISSTQAHMSKMDLDTALKVPIVMPYIWDKIL